MTFLYNKETDKLVGEHTPIGITGNALNKQQTKDLEEYFLDEQKYSKDYDDYFEKTKNY